MLTRYYKATSDKGQCYAIEVSIKSSLLQLHQTAEAQLAQRLESKPKLFKRIVDGAEYLCSKYLSSSVTTQKLQIAAKKFADILCSQSLLSKAATGHLLKKCLESLPQQMPCELDCKLSAVSCNSFKEKTHQHTISKESSASEARLNSSSDEATSPQYLNSDTFLEDTSKRSKAKASKTLSKSGLSGSLLKERDTVSSPVSQLSKVSGCEKLEFNYGVSDLSMFALAPSPKVQESTSAAKEQVSDFFGENTIILSEINMDEIPGGLKGISNLCSNYGNLIEARFYQAQRKVAVQYQSKEGADFAMDNLNLAFVPKAGLSQAKLYKSQECAIDLMSQEYVSLKAEPSRYRFKNMVPLMANKPDLTLHVSVLGTGKTCITTKEIVAYLQETCAPKRVKRERKYANMWFFELHSAEDAVAALMKLHDESYADTGYFRLSFTKTKKKQKAA